MSEHTPLPWKFVTRSYYENLIAENKQMRESLIDIKNIVEQARQDIPIPKLLNGIKIICNQALNESEIKHE